MGDRGGAGWNLIGNLLRFATPWSAAEIVETDGALTSPELELYGYPASRAGGWHSVVGLSCRRG